jgi:fumarylacetoacetate (FAA) hydrolase
VKLATLRDGTRDGALVVVSRDGTRCATAKSVAPTLQAALDDWPRASALLHALADRVERDAIGTEPLHAPRLAAPLPRAYEWVDGSAYPSHIVLVRRARGAEPPKTLLTEPLVYQGGSSVLLGPTDPLVVPDVAWGADFEAEVCVILGDTPRGVTADRAADHVKLLTLANDVTYRNLVPDELEKGFGFFCSKPATAFAPFAVTPDELGAAWRGGRVHLRMRTYLDGVLVGDPEAGDAMHFSFFDLLAHISKTRAFAAGAILGSGTVSNEDPARGASCLAERRAREVLEHGAPRTPFLAPGNRVRIEMLAADGSNPFGSIAQEVTAG